jgi:hypothetical protein
MIHESDRTEGMSLTLGLVRGELRKLIDGRTFAPMHTLKGGVTKHFFLPDAFAVLAGIQYLGEDSYAQVIKTFNVIAKPVTVVTHNGGTEYELMFASFHDEEKDCITLGMEGEVLYKDIGAHDYYFEQDSPRPPDVIDVVGTLMRSSEAGFKIASLMPAGQCINSAGMKTDMVGFISGPTMGGECRSLHIGFISEGEYSIVTNAKGRYQPNAWVSATRLLEDSNTFEKLCPWSVQFVEALRAEQSHWTPERKQGLKTIR